MREFVCETNYPCWAQNLMTTRSIKVTRMRVLAMRIYIELHYTFIYAKSWHMNRRLFVEETSFLLHDLKYRGSYALAVWTLGKLRSWWPSPLFLFLLSILSIASHLPPPPHSLFYLLAILYPVTLCLASSKVLFSFYVHTLNTFTFVSHLLAIP